MTLLRTWVHWTVYFRDSNSLQLLPLPLFCKMLCLGFSVLSSLRTLLFPRNFLLCMVPHHTSASLSVLSVHFVNTFLCLSLMLLIPKETNKSSVGELSCFVNLFLRKGNWHLNFATLFLIRRKVRSHPVRIFKNPSHSILVWDNVSLINLTY